MAKVSVIIPVYGVEKYLNEALDSVVNQTLKDLEIILIDDGGKDNCPSIIDEYASKDSRIIAVHKPNGGYGQSCNVGLERATGEYIAIMEPDDYIDSHMYEELYDIAQKYDSDIVKSPYYSNCEDVVNKGIIYNDFTRYYNIPKTSFNIFEAPSLLYEHPSIWSALYKREFLNSNGIRFKEAPGAGWTDNPFQIQTLCLAKKINYTSKAYYYWRILNDNPSKELKDYKLPFLRCAEIREWLKENGYYVPELLSSYYRKELSYIKITLGMENIPDKEDYIARVTDMVQNMEKDVVLNSKYLNKKEKQLYLKVLKSPQKAFARRGIGIWKRKIKDFKRSFIRVKINSSQVKLRILNKTLIDFEK